MGNNNGIPNPNIIVTNEIFNIAEYL